MRRVNRHRWFMLLVGFFLFVAAFLRFYRIDVQSLWSDEGNSVAMAPRPLLEIVQRTALDIHPPLYYIVLHLWASLFGTSEAAVRSLSALFGVVTVALTVAIGHRLGSRRMALLVAVPATVAPFAIHYSQEARMYMMVTMLGAASWLLLLSILQPERLERRRLRPVHGAYVVVTLALLYTHYYAVSLLLAENLVWLWHWLRTKQRDRARWAEWISLQGSLAVLYLPWIWYARRSIFGWPSISPEVSFGFIARETFQVFSLGLANEGLSWWSAAGFGILLFIGMLASLRRGLRGVRTEAGRTPHALLYFIVPPLLMFLLSLDRPFWNPKFLLIALPGYHLLLALGAATLLDWVERQQRRLYLPLAMLLLGFFPVAAATPLQNEYWEPRYWRDDYRAITRTIEAQATPGDAVLLSGSGQVEIFDYYYDGNLPRYPLPVHRPMHVAETIGRLEQIKQAHDRLYAIWWAEREGDPKGVIPGWLDQNAFQAGSRWFGNVRMEIYRLSELPPPEPLDVSFTLPESGASLHLQGMSIDPQQVVAGEVVALNSRWVARGLDGVPVTFFVQLLDRANHVIGQYDGSGGAAPATEWAADQPHVLRMGVPVPAGTVPGEYRVIVGAYRSDSGQRFMKGDTNSYSLGTIRVEAPVVPPTVDALALDHGMERNTSFGDATLVGARANKLGFDHAPETPIAPGEPVGLLLVWQADRAAPAVPSLRLRLLDQGGQAVTEWKYQPVEGRYSPSRWRDRELVRDLQVRFLPAQLAPGRYRLVLESETQKVSIATLTVEP